MITGKARFISLAAATCCLIICILVLAGWHLPADTLTSFIPGKDKMQYNAALAMIAAAVSIILYHYPGNHTFRSHPAALIFPVFVILTGLLTLAEHISGNSVGIDELFVYDSTTQPGMYPAGRIYPLSALNFVCLGICILLLYREKYTNWQFVFLAVVIITSLLTFTGYVFSMDMPKMIRMPLPATTAFILAAAAGWYAQPVLRHPLLFKRKMQFGFMATIILLIFIILFAYYYNEQRQETARMVSHTNEVLRESEQTLSLIKDIESGARAYVLTGDSSYLTYFLFARENVQQHAARLQELTRDNAEQNKRADSLRSLVKKRIAFSMRYITLRNTAGFEAARNLMMTPEGKTYTIAIREITASMRAAENELLMQRQQQNAASIVLFNRAFFVLLTGIFILMVMLFVLNRRNIARTETEGDRLQEFNRQLEQKIKERTEEIVQSEKRYRYLFDNNPLPMWVISLDDFRFLDVNGMAVQQYGYSRSEFLSMTAMDIRPESERSSFIQSDHALNTVPGAYARGIWIHQKKDGTLLEAEIHGHDIVYEGKPARFILAHDVTEKRKAEQKLVASERQFRYTLDNMLEGVQIIDFNWRYIYVNDSFCRHGKYPKEEMLGYTVMEKYPGIEQTEIYKVYQRCFTERVSIHLENEFIFPDGTTGWFELSFQPVPEGIFILSIDITERKRTEESIRQAEANYREIFEKAGDAIHVIETGTWKVLEANQKASEITGYSRQELVEGNRQNLLTQNPAYNEAAVEQLLKKAAAGEPQFFEWLTQHKNGDVTWLEVDLKKATIAGKERLLSFYRQINDRKKAQQEIQEWNEKLEQKVTERTTQLESVNKELEAFSYSVSHDLRAPLRAIVGFSAMLENKYAGQLDEEGKRITSVIRNNTIRMGALIDDLLAFSRLGRQEIVKNHIVTQTMVQEVMQELRPAEHAVKWIAGHLPDSLGDATTIRQVWINLLSNALKYSRSVAEPVIETGSFTENRETVFFVKDNGVGFDERYKHKLFKVFQRLHSSNEFEGTGVGLAIVEKIISKHGGRVWASSEKDKGACFYFSLPAL